MHPSIDDLLALRDGNGAAEAARHVEQCARCADEIDELRSAASALRALPEATTDRDHWPEIRRRVRERRRRDLTLRIGAVAASIVAVITAVVLVTSPPPTTTHEVATADAELAVDELAAASRGLEAVLRDPALRRQVLSPRRAAVIVDIEDRIAVLDMALADQPIDWGVEQNVALWSHRVELLDALVEARGETIGDEGLGYAVIQYEGSQP
ncbi:MAG: hypothetical protein QNL88_17145 [Acidobacteriota bacterium]|nr:hypothetical protein [Acidobacteriota bacterium]